MNVPTFSQLAEQFTVPHLAIFGGGAMAKCMVNGALTAGFLKKDQISISTRTEKSAQVWRNEGFVNSYGSALEQNQMHTKGIALIAVKPQMRHSLWNSGVDFSGYSAIVSVMAGVTIEMIKKEISQLSQSVNSTFIRIFPNSPCSIGEGITLMCKQGRVDPDIVSIVKGFVCTFSKWYEVSESQFNSAGAISASSPAWTYIYIESLADGGVLSGLSRNESLKLAAEAVMGAAKMVLQEIGHPGQLKDQVCSPAGTTIAGVRQLEKNGFRSSVIEAVKATTERAQELEKTE